MLNFITDLARRAGELARERRLSMTGEAVHTKATETDLVTDIDREVERFILAETTRKTPDYSVFGEESGRRDSGSEWCWVIDPIDGTVSFVHDLAYYSVSIALCRNGRPMYGAVYAPRLGELYTAERGKGAFLNGKSIRVSRRSELVEAVLGTGFACVRERRSENNIARFGKLLPQLRGIRRCGSAALDLGMVAAGRYDGFWELALAPYDVAAGVLLVEEAGGVVTDLNGGKNFPEKGIIAANGILNEKLLEQLK